MNKVNEKAKLVLDVLLTMCEESGGHIKIDNAPGRYMPLCVETTMNNCLSVAHYGEQNGDAMRDPDMVFWKSPAGEWFPVSYQNDFAGVYHEAVTEWAGGMPKAFKPRMQADQAQFAAVWMENLVEQQKLEVPE